MQQLVNERSIAIGVLLLSASVGLLIHPFYDWTGADQSRAVAIFWQIPAGIAAALLLCCCALPWLPIQREAATLGRRNQFSLRMLLVITALLSILLATAIHSPAIYSKVMFLALSLLVAYYWKRSAAHRWSVVALLGAMYLPFLWVFSVDWNFQGSWGKLLISCLSMPALLPTELLLEVLRLGRDEGWLVFGATLISIEVLVGLSCIRIGPKRGFIAIVLILILSMFGSLGLNTLYRA